MSASNDDLDGDGVRSRGVDRRTLIKGAAVAGAAAWTAPMLLDSFSSAASAAACSAAATITQLGVITERASQSSVTSQATLSVTSAVGSRVVVFIATMNSGSSTSSSVTNVTGNPITGAAALTGTPLLDYSLNSATGRTHDLFAWAGTGGGTGAITVTFSTTNPPESIDIAVYQIVGAPTQIQTRTGVSGTTPSTSASTANYTLVPPANNGEVWCLAAARGVNSNSVTSNSGGWTEAVAGGKFNLAGGGNSRTYLFDPAERVPAAQTSGTFTISNTSSWAAIRVYYGC